MHPRAVKVHPWAESRFSLFDARAEEASGNQDLAYKGRCPLGKVDRKNRHCILGLVDVPYEAWIGLPGEAIPWKTVFF